MATIRISDEVMKALKDEAVKRGKAFISPDNILRLILGLPPAGRKQG